MEHADALGREELAIRMKVTPELIDVWLAGHASMPDRKFVALTEVLDQAARKP